MEAVQYLFSSVVLTGHFLKHIDIDVRTVRKKVQLFTGWTIQLASEDSKLRPLIWSRICFLCRLLQNFKYIYHSSNSECHISMNLQPISTKTQKKDFYGSIVFINSETFKIFI